MAIDHHRRSHEAHGSHTDRISDVLQLVLERGDLRIGIARADNAQARGLLAEDHAGIFRTSKANADDSRLTGEPSFAEPDQGVEVKALDTLDSVAWKQHAVVGPEQSALVHGGEVDPGGFGMEGIFDLRRV